MNFPIQVPFMAIASWVTAAASLIVFSVLLAAQHYNALPALGVFAQLAGIATLSTLAYKFGVRTGALAAKSLEWLDENNLSTKQKNGRDIFFAIGALPFLLALVASIDSITLLLIGHPAGLAVTHVAVVAWVLSIAIIRSSIAGWHNGNPDNLSNSSD
jgi:hypothetical protein